MIIDIIAGIAIVLGFARGYSKGIIGTIFTLVGLILAIVGSMKLSPLFINAIENLMPNSPRLSYIVGFLGTFILIFLLIVFIGKRLEGLFKITKLNFINKLIGGAITAMVFLLVYSSILWFLNQARLISEPQKDQSMTYLQLEPIPEMAREQFTAIKPVFQDFWNKTIEVFDTVKERGESIQQEQAEPTPNKE